MPMNPEKRYPGREAFLEKMRLKYNVVDPELNFDNPNYRDPDQPSFDPKYMTINQYQGPWEDAQISHLIRRTKFGVTIEDLRYFRSLDLNQAVDLLLTEAPVPAPPVNDYNNGVDPPDPDVPFGETWINAPLSDFEGDKVMSLKKWWIHNMIEQGHSITEKLLLFWHNHIPTEWWGVFQAKSSYKYIELLRKHQMGNFKDLIKEMTIDVSMLFYLNGVYNHRDAPDENYARELQELFCIGKGPNANYTEGDVQAAARVLTGWTASWPELEGYYDIYRHDNNDKQFSDFYNNKVIEGRSGMAGKEELDDLIDMIFDNEETSLFICRKIYAFFVYPELSQEIEENIIEPLAQILRDNNFVVKPVLETLFKSEHFYDANVKGSIIKDPANFLVGNWRTLNPPVDFKDDLFNYGELKASMIWTMHNKGMQLGDPPNVSGWPAYYQAPIYDKGWITTNTITARAIETDSLVYWGFWSPIAQIPADLVAFTDSLDNPEDPNKLVDQFVLLFFGHDVNQNVKNRFKNILISGQSEDYYWTNAWLEHKADPSNDFLRKTVEDRLKWTMQRVLQLAEGHLM